MFPTDKDGNILEIWDVVLSFVENPNYLYFNYHAPYQVGIVSDGEESQDYDEHGSQMVIDFPDSFVPLNNYDEWRIVKLQKDSNIWKINRYFTKLLSERMEKNGLKAKVVGKSEKWLTNSPIGIYIINE